MAEHNCPFFLPQRSSKLSTSTTTVQNECELKSAPICSPRRHFGAKLCEYVPLLSGYETGHCGRRPTAVDRPWASCTFQTGNSCTSSFLSGRFLDTVLEIAWQCGPSYLFSLFLSLFLPLFSNFRASNPKLARDLVLLQSAN